MAEAILRTAHEAYADRVKKITSLAGVNESEEKTEDAYADFKKIVDGFYGKLDESDDADLKVFADLFQALHEIHKIAVKNGDEQTKNELESFMDECSAVLNRQTELNLETAETIANYLQSIVEANVDGAEDEWKVSDTDVHDTINGDHPRMAWAAQQQDAVASKFNGDWADEGPVSDGKSYKNGLADEMKNRSWGNHSGEGIYPDLTNPYTPKPFGDYKMKEPSAVDDGENDWSRFQSGDTWPNLNNPYVPTGK